MRSAVAVSLFLSRAQTNKAYGGLIRDTRNGHVRTANLSVDCLFCYSGKFDCIAADPDELTKRQLVVNYWHMCCKNEAKQRLRAAQEQNDRKAIEEAQRDPYLKDVCGDRAVRRSQCSVVR